MVNSGEAYVEEIVTDADLRGLAEEWRALEVAAGTNLPFQTWEWSTSWWTHLHEDGPGVRDLMRVCVVRDESGQVIGIAPLMLTERPGFGPLRVRILQFFGADPNITELRSMLCRPGYTEKFHRAIRLHLASRSKDWDWIAWDGCDTASNAFMSNPLLGVEPKLAYVLPLAATWVEMKRDLKRNIKESLRKCYNSLKRSGLTCELEVHEDPAAIAQCLPDFFRLHTARAQLDTTLGHADVFESAQSVAFLTDVCQRLAKRGVAKVFQLRVDGQVVATRIGFELAGTLYLYYSGWEPAYGQYSVMTTLTAEIIQCAIQRGLGAVHLSTGRDVSKTRWGAREVNYLSGMELSPHSSARALFLMYQAASRLGAGRVARAVAPAKFVRRSAASSPREMEDRALAAQTLTRT